MLQLKRHHADTGLTDKTDVFIDEFQIGAGDDRNLLELVLSLLIIYLCKNE